MPQALRIERTCETSIAELTVVEVALRMKLPVSIVQAIE